jgi:hypothetical protein
VKELGYTALLSAMFAIETALQPGVNVGMKLHHSFCVRACSGQILEDISCIVNGFRWILGSR